MDIIKNQQDSTITIVIDEPLKAQNLSELQKLVAELSLGFGTKLIIDCTDMDYICSSGLRVFLQLSKDAKQVGASLVVRGLQPLVLNVFQITGFDKFIAIE